MLDKPAIPTAQSLNFRDDGISIFEDMFPKGVTEDIVTTFHSRLKVQAYKLRLIEDASPATEINVEQIDDLVQKVNATSKAALDFVVQSLRETPAASATMCQPRFLEAASDLLKCPVSLLKTHMDGILINLPKNETRLYKFHSEAHYYPQRRNFLNFWMPVIRPKTTDNGSMVVKLRAHKNSYQFIEYTGFNSKESNDVSEADFFHQLQIPEDDLSDYEDFVCSLQPNTAVFFHQNLPHTSTVNLSSAPSYTLIMRVYDYRYDATLSDNTGVKSYTSAAARGGFPNLRPMRLAD